MKVKVITNSIIEDEILIQCKSITPEIQRVIDLLESQNKKIECIDTDNQKFYVNPIDVLYIESIDGTTYIYTSNRVGKTRSTLQELEDEYSTADYFRGAKNLIVNIQHIESLKSQLNGRIIVTLNNEEMLVISRHYARLFKQKLKGEQHEKI
ncbi:LytTR family DNA-binding domain-containing protein [Anaerorhabdus sp.]|uniref:LytTR family DNA-binding domain-containing protein n=1 Tax=Anaerorhabdus sp. TaxID=1872524 RepID=UPI002B2099BA|nr:LytTR family DNA-binding domain-containing protein [Anaerorhabdus sp.]MEA4874820.1 LytTR family DNA-binding domain-containing protein [Anaerorhabdus sp.]